MQGDPPAAGALPDECEGVVDRLRQIEVREFQLHPSRLDFRQIVGEILLLFNCVPGWIDEHRVLRGAAGNQEKTPAAAGTYMACS